jgi:hypothetical protein
MLYPVELQARRGAARFFGRARNRNIEGTWWGVNKPLKGMLPRESAQSEQFLKSVNPIFLFGEKGWAAAIGREMLDERRAASEN